jgi:hypothetical protein
VSPADQAAAKAAAAKAHAALPNPTLEVRPWRLVKRPYGVPWLWLDGHIEGLGVWLNGHVECLAYIACHVAHPYSESPFVRLPMTVRAISAGP